MRAFFRVLESRVPGAPPASAPYSEWQEWSVRAPADFWSEWWGFAQIVADRRPDGAMWETVLAGGENMCPPGDARGPHWFVGARLNFAENLLRRRDDTAALVFCGEDGARQVLSCRQIHLEAGRVAAALTRAGVRPGDRVAGYLPNIPETVIAMLGAAWIGAVWSSCSPDFGVEGVLDRFGQIAPRVLIAADGYRYAGKEIDCALRLSEIAAALPSVERLVVVPFLRANPDLASVPRSALWHKWLAASPDAAPAFARLPFDHPLYVMYSSGTTGLPKCLVHGAGGTLLQHLKEHRLHCDVRAGETVFYFTTCGWMMWNWLVSALASDATVVLYDGAPMPPSNPGVLWDLAARERVNVFGTSARFLALAEKAGLAPRRTHDLSDLRTILSTGSPLAPASFDYVARDVKPGVQLASISGGTDIISCFALANPLVPVWRGELQAPGLGMAVDVLDDEGRSLRGAPGELVCTRPFPSMPIAFWNDPEGVRYREAYFDFFPGMWRHGDWAEITEHGGLVIHGRSDATLNPGGVRIGTAEIYRIVEQFPEVLESIAIGRQEGDGGVVLFVRLREEQTLSDDLVRRVQRRIRESASPHHVPQLILQVDDIPRTISGKITELAVRDAFAGRAVRNTGAMANPRALEQYRALGARYRS
jgi:acetoacetyl-CoA synthetase